MRELNAKRNLYEQRELRIEMRDIMKQRRHRTERMDRTEVTCYVYKKVDSNEEAYRRITLYDCYQSPY